MPLLNVATRRDIAATVGFIRRRVATPALVMLLGTAVLVMVAWAALDALTPARTATLNPASIQSDKGFSYSVKMPLDVSWPLEIRGDGPSSQFSSRIALAEDGRVLGPAHARHDAIRGKGAGQYSHWADTLLFSASDNSDPRTNARSYTLTVRPHGSPELLWIAGGLVALAVMFFGRELRAVSRTALCRVGLVAALVSFSVSALVASGFLGRAALGQDEPKDAALVLSLLTHASIGIAVTLVQCAISAGVGRFLFRRPDMPLAQAMLLGFPASLVLLALGALITLKVPGGSLLSLLVLAFLLLPLRKDSASLIRMRPALTGLAAVVMSAAAFGIWMGLLWHGPTATLPGWPAGDLVFYSSLVSTLAAEPFPLRNWGNEGESSAPFNLLWPAIGAALSRVFDIEPFAFVITAGATAFLLCTAIILWAYVVATRSRPGVRRGGMLALGVLAAGRYPFWIVESPPMIHTVALTIAIWFWVTNARGAPSRAVGATAMALVGATLTKIGSAVTLVPLTLGPLASELKNLSSAARIAVAALGTTVVAYAAWLLATFAPRLLAVGGIGPEAYVWMFKWESSLAITAPYLLRDIGAVFLTLAAFFLAPWWTAIPIAGGVLLGGLIVPFTMRAAFVSAVVLITLVAFEASYRVARIRWLIILGLILCVPAMLLTDPGGLLTGFVWTACVGVIVHVAVGGEVGSPSGASGYPTQAAGVARYTTVVWAAAMAAFLIAVGRGQIGTASNWLGGTQKLAPDVYAVWHAVPEVVPRDALVFTDQTGTSWGLLEGWNTYALHSKRQLFISTWVQSGELQADEQKRLAKLHWNDRVLDGSLPPTAVPLSRQYTSFYAVVNGTRAPRLTGWLTMRVVGPYAILRWDGPPAAAQGTGS
jgi:hypothetical protein